MHVAGRFHVMTKPRGAICNLDCEYCYFLSKERLYPNSTFRMSETLLEEYIRQYIESQSASHITFAWQGGEPTLMGLDFYRQAVACQQRYCPSGVVIENTIQTNAVLLDDDWCQFFRDNRFLVGVSLDGPQPLHDLYRVDKGGQPTFQRVMAGIQRLQAHGVDFNILTTVHAGNVDHALTVYRFLRDEVGTQFIQFIPIVEPAIHEGDVTEWSVPALGYGQFLMAIFDEWVRRDVGRVFVQIFDVALAAWAGYPAGLCVFEEVCGTALALEHNGDVYTCDHYVDPEFHVGNIQTIPLSAIAISDKQVQFGLAKRDSLPAYCRECSVRFVCHGGCPKDRFVQTPTGEAGLNYLCAGYKAFFTHIDGPMRFMANELKARRSPANVMDYMRYRDTL